MSQHQDQTGPSARADGTPAADTSAGHAPNFWPEALEVIRSAPIALLATTHGLQPHVRPVTPAYVGLDAYILTTSGSFKVRQIERNPRVELLHWSTDFRHLNLAGCATMTEDHDKINDVAPYFPYVVDDFFGAHIRPPVLVKVSMRRISITTFNDIIADKRPRIWRVSE